VHTSQRAYCHRGAAACLDRTCSGQQPAAHSCSFKEVNSSAPTVGVLLVLSMLCLSSQEKAQAQGFANALSTIGKFVLKKKAGDKDQLYST
jgi:hypothetical protein